jgi:serine/threonine-protein kinase
MKTPNTMFPDGGDDDSGRERWKFRIVPRTVLGRRRMLAAAFLAGAGLAGYIITLILFPRPLFKERNVVPNVIGMPIERAQKELEDAGFKVVIAGGEKDPELPAGAISWQEPPAYVEAAPGATVSLLRSEGPSSIAIPDLRDFDPEIASKVLAASGLTVGKIDSVPSTAEAEVIVGTRPPAGTLRLPGSKIDVLVSQGAADVETPNVVGLSLEDARQVLESYGLRLGRIIRTSGGQYPNVVLSQRPAERVKVARRTRVDLTLSARY